MFDPNSIAPVISFADAIVRLTTAVPAAQRDLDEDFAHRCEEYIPVADLVRGAGFEELAKALTPTPVALTNAEIDFTFAFAATAENEFSVRVLNSAWAVRYRSSSTQMQTARVSIKRTPLKPGFSAVSGGEA